MSARRTMKLAIPALTLFLGGCITPTFAFQPKGGRSASPTQELADALKAYEGQDCWIYTENGHCCVTINDPTGIPKTRLEFVGRDYIKVSGEKYIPLTSLGHFIGRKR